MAVRVEPGRVQATHQSLHHLIAKADWSDAVAPTVVRSRILPAIEQHGPIQAWIIDDTGFPEKGTHSAGVARQYCGQLGKQDNYQVAVSLSVANEQASLPQVWADDAAQRNKAGVPEELRFATKPQIARRGWNGTSCGVERTAFNGHRYNEAGLDGRPNHRNTGAPPRKLTAHQEATLAGWVRDGPKLEQYKVVRWRLVDLRDEIARQFGVQIHERSVGKLMASYGRNWVTAV